MPRQRRGAPARAPTRPTINPNRPVGSQQPSRPASTAAHPPAVPRANGAPAQASQGPGLFGQMASTAAYGIDSSLRCPGYTHPTFYLLFLADLLHLLGELL